MSCKHRTQEIGSNGMKCFDCGLIMCEHRFVETNDSKKCADCNANLMVYHE